MDHDDWQQIYIEARAGEHGASSTALVVLQSTVLLTVEDLPAWRKSRHGNHKEARALLQTLAKEPEAEPIDLTVIWKDWRARVQQRRLGIRG